MFVGLEPFVVLALKESSPKNILVSKAKKMRLTGDSQSIAPAEEAEIDLRALFNTYLSKPLRLFYHEPILAILTIHLTFVYGTLYLAYQM